MVNAVKSKLKTETQSTGIKAQDILPHKEHQEFLLVFLTFERESEIEFLQPVTTHTDHIGLKSGEILLPQ